MALYQTHDGGFTMSSSNEQDMLEQGLAALKAGDKNTAQTMLREVVKLNPRLIEAWMGLAQTTTDPVRQRTCYENVLKIDPDHNAARAALATLSAQDVPASSEGDAANTPSVESLRPKVTPVASSASFKPPQNIPGAPSQFSLDDLLDSMKKLMASLRGTAGQAGDEAALPITWWNVVMLVVVAGALTGFISVVASILYALIKGYGFNFGTVFALITFTILTPLEMGAGLAGASVMSRWFLQWRGKAEGTLLEHTMAIARPWFGATIGIAAVGLIGSILGSPPSVSTLESVLRYFSLTVSDSGFVVLILNILLALGAVYLIGRSWAKLYPDSLGLNRTLAAVLALFIISLAV